MSMLAADIEYAERGDGRAILFVPGSFGTGAGWKLVMDKLGTGYRFVTTSLLGYGGTRDCRPLNNATMMQQVDALDSIIARIDAPVHVVAHSYGGLCTLAHALYGKHKAVGMTLAEANPFKILETAGETAHLASFDAMTKLYFAEFAAEKPDAARLVIDFYGGAGTYDAFPPKVRDYVVSTTASNIRDWSSGGSFTPHLSEYGRIIAPVHIVRGGNGHPAMLRIAEILATALPNAKMSTIEGGSHFLPASHPTELAALIAADLAAHSV